MSALTHTLTHLATFTHLANLAAIDPATIFAQVPDIPASSDGLPGAELVTKALGWTRWAALIACVFGFLFGAGSTAVGERGGNTMMARRGKEFLLGSVLGAALVGLGPEILNAFYSA